MLGLIGAVAGVPAVLGVTEAVKQGQKQNERERHRARKSNLVVQLPRKNKYSAEFDGSLVVLKNNKLYVDNAHSMQGCHPFTGYYLPYPGTESRWKGAGFKGEGMVSTISDDPPMLNWVYVDADTHELKYGVKADTLNQIVGPWDVTETDRRVTLEGWEGFTAVREDPAQDEWAIYFDKNNNGLRSTQTGQRRIGDDAPEMLFIELWRRERQKTQAVAEEERLERLQKRREREEKERDQAIEDGRVEEAEEHARNAEDIRKEEELNYYHGGFREEIED